MSLSITFYNNIKYTKDDFMNRDRDFFGNGVVNASDFALSFPTTPNMTCTVGAGTAWVDGYRISNDANPITLSIQPADTSPRIDIVQIGHDDMNSAAVLMIKKGSPAASPIEPAPDSGYLKLYAISVAANATSISNSNVIDRRSLVPLKVSGTQISFDGAATTSSNTFTGTQTAPEFVATSETAPLQLPNLTALPTQVGPAGTICVTNGKWYISNGTEWSEMAPPIANIVTTFGNNLLNPNAMSFYRKTAANKKSNLATVQPHMLRTEMGKFGHAAFIEESTTQLVANSDFETITGTGVMFSDTLTGTTAPAWTVRGGSFTYGATGATSSATNSVMTAGNSVWKPLIGSGGQSLSITAQATYSMPSPLPANNDGVLDLWQTYNANGYRLELYSGKLQLYKMVNATWTTIGSVTQALSAGSSYTMTLSVSPTGTLTGKLYSGTDTTGTLLQTIVGTDTSLTGGYVIGVGGDNGVAITNVMMTAPQPDGWVFGGDSRAAWGLTQTAISGNYSLSAVGCTGMTNAWAVAGAAVYGAASANTVYTMSGTISTQNVGSHQATMIVNFYDSTSTYLSQTGWSSGVSGTTTAQRYSFQATSPANTSFVAPVLQLADAGTVIFEAIQMEQKSYVTTYVRNDSAATASLFKGVDSLSYSLSVPLPTRWFGALYWRPNMPSTAYTGQAIDRTLVWTINNTKTAWRHLIDYRADGCFRFGKGGGSTVKSSVTTFNANDTIFIAWLDDPVSGSITLWVGVNGGTLNMYSTADVYLATDAQTVYLGCRDMTGTVPSGGTGYECNGTIDFPLITDQLPTTAMVQALYQAGEWGGMRHFPLVSATSATANTLITPNLWIG